MNRRLTTLLLVLVIVGVSIPLVSGSVVAQESGDGTGVDDVTNEQQNGDSEESDEGPQLRDVTVSIDNSTTITGADWNHDGQVVLRIEADTSTRIQIVDSNSIESTGYGSINAIETRLDEGTNTVRIDATSRLGSKTLTFWTPDGNAYYSSPSEPLIEDVDYAHLYIAGSAAGISPILVGFTYVWWRKRKLDNSWTSVFKNHP